MQKNVWKKEDMGENFKALCLTTHQWLMDLSAVLARTPGECVSAMDSLRTMERAVKFYKFSRYAVDRRTGEKILATRIDARFKVAFSSIRPSPIPAYGDWLLRWVFPTTSPGSAFELSASGSDVALAMVDLDTWLIFSDHGAQRICVKPLAEQEFFDKYRIVTPELGSTEIATMSPADAEAEVKRKKLLDSATWQLNRAKNIREESMKSIAQIDKEIKELQDFIAETAENKVSDARSD